MEEIEKLKKKLKKEFNDIAEVNEDSDFPIHEKFTKEGKIKKIKK